MTPLQSQLLGISLASITAVGCIFYEKLVHNFSYFIIILLLLIEILFLTILSLVVFKNTIHSDYLKLISNKKYFIWLGICCLSSTSSIIWYVLTRHQGVMAGSLYEIKYVVVLAILYILFGDDKFTMNTGIGMFLAMGSIYFISRT